MIKPWSERASRSSGIPMACERITSVFQGFGSLTREGWPAWAAQRFIEDYPVFDDPAEYTYENLVHYAVNRLANDTDRPNIGKDLEQIDPRKYSSDSAREDALYDILYRILIDPLIFLSRNHEQAFPPEKHQKGE